MEKLKKHIKSDKFKWFISFGAIALCLILLIGVFAKVGNLETTHKITNSDYQIATINSSGVVADSNQHIVSDKLVYEDAEIKLNDGATITYKVAFYDEDGDYLGITSALSSDFATTNIPSTITQANIEYFRVEITPAVVDGEAVNVNLLTMHNYTSQLSVVVAK